LEKDRYRTPAAKAGGDALSVEIIGLAIEVHRPQGRPPETGGRLNSFLFLRASFVLFVALWFPRTGSPDLEGSSG
jgi:hypothetical protein